MAKGVNLHVFAEPEMASALCIAIEDRCECNAYPVKTGLGDIQIFVHTDQQPTLIREFAMGFMAGWASLQRRSRCEFAVLEGMSNEEEY